MFADADADVHGYCNSYRYSERHTKTSPDSAASPDASTAPVVRIASNPYEGSQAR